MVVGGSLLRTVAVAGDRQLVSSDVLCGERIPALTGH